MWNTKITKLLDIDYPIIQGAMAYISDAALVSSVCAAGGTGVLATGRVEIDYIREQIRAVKDATNKSFGVNLMLQSPNKDDVAQLCIDEKVPFVTVGAGNPLPFIEPLQAHGIKVIPVVPNVKLAKRVQEKGADAIVIEGMEAGGHDGKLTVMALMENVIPEMEIPVIAAGGIADGRAIAAALVMGASGVQIGSRFLLSDDCHILPVIKDAIINAVDTDSVVTGFTTKDTVRGLRNAWSDKFLEMERTGATQEELNQAAIGTTYKALAEGDLENGFVLVGMSLHRLTKKQSTKEIMEDLISETESRLAGAAGLIK